MREAKDVKQMFTAISAGADRSKLPELLSVLRPRQAEAMDYREYNNSGWRQFEIDVKGEPVRMICWDCGGWVINS
jgi:hypothetical protein